MPSCIVSNCPNRSGKGILLKCFPSDPIRREKWIQSIERKDRVPNKYSRICEVHFESSMWEKTRVDGSRKLKSSAVPTLFTPEQKLKNKESKKESNVLVLVQPAIITPEDFIEIIMPSTPSVNNVETNTKPSEQLPNATDTKDAVVLQRLIKQYQVKCQRLLVRNRRQHNLLKNARYKVNSLEKVIANLNQEKLLQNIFNDDQIRALKRSSTKFMKWSDDTLKKALQLKVSCGNNGYKELLRQKIPLPSLRTLRRICEHNEKQ